MRYTENHNFIGRPIVGYETPECILTREAAVGLKAVQTELRPKGYSLKVYDCYRPQRAVNDFIAWSKDPSTQQMKAEFYPRVDKSKTFTLGYIAARSGHSRGSTSDLTIVPLNPKAEPVYIPGQPLVACYAPYHQRYADNSLDMGTGFDCLDEHAHSNFQGLTPMAYYNRMLFRNVMAKHGFVVYAKEWWHFTLKKEPYPNTYFDFPVA
jgi:D-alanyl-D-alanine dipeptidase